VERVAIRRLRDGLGMYLRRVRAGESLLITDRDRPVAQLSPANQLLAVLAPLADEGLIEWKGGKPRGSARPARVRGGSVSDLVLDERR
jgi:prevent-host-death family protein